MFESILSLVIASAVLLGSPGPAPLALAATSATYGIRNSIPFFLGILAGLAVAIVGATAGMATLFAAFPTLKLAVQLVGACYILYVAQKIARAPVLSSANENDLETPRFRDGFILNLLNPKAYAAFMAIFSQFLLPLQTASLSFIFTGLTCFIVAFIVDSIWLGLGGLLRPIFEAEKSARILRIIFACLMVVAVIFALFY